VAVVKSMDLVEVVREHLAAASPDVLRSLVETFANALMSACAIQRSRTPVPGDPGQSFRLIPDGWGGDAGRLVMELWFWSSWLAGCWGVDPAVVWAAWWWPGGMGRKLGRDLRGAGVAGLLVRFARGVCRASALPVWSGLHRRVGGCPNAGLASLAGWSERSNALGEGGHEGGRRCRREGPLRVMR
jgi:hypothetical protein